MYLVMFEIVGQILLKSNSEKILALSFVGPSQLSTFAICATVEIIKFYRDH